MIEGNKYTNQQLMDHFKIGKQGGMRKSNKTNSLVLFTMHHKGQGPYNDRWLDSETLLYTGMGLKGDMSLNFMQNKTLNESPSNNIRIYYFESFKKNEYIYRGELVKYGDPIREIQLDINNTQRLAWVFRLKLKNNQSNTNFLDNTNIDKKGRSMLDKLENRETKNVKSLSTKHLEKIVYGLTGNFSRNVLTKRYNRNPYISELSKRLADGICQLCKNKAPFIDKFGSPFLENHHIIWLKNSGQDSINNCVALCPNCHRKMHALNDPNDIKILKKVITDRNLKL